MICCRGVGWGFRRGFRLGVCWWIRRGCWSGCRCRYFNWCCRRPEHQRGGAEVGPWCDDLLDPRRIGAQLCVAGRFVVAILQSRGPTVTQAICGRPEGSDSDLFPRSIRLFKIQRPAIVALFQLQVKLFRIHFGEVANQKMLYIAYS